MKAIKAADMRELDARTITEDIKSGEELMETAGSLASREIFDFICSLPERPYRKIVILAGKGNNAGDAFVVARLLSKWKPEFDISLHCVCAENEFSGDTLTMFRKMPENIRKNIKYTLEKNDLNAPAIVIDGLLGTGMKGALRDPCKTWIALVNAMQQPTVAIDIPSGLDADTGFVQDDAVIADMTVTMAYPKIGLLINEGIRRTGRLRVLDIGIPPEFAEEITDFLPVQTIEDIRPSFFREKFDTYKNIRGHVLIIGGSRNYPSAPFLCAEAALRTGAGLVTVAIPESVEIFCNVPKAVIVRRFPDDGLGFFTCSSLEGILALAEKADSIALGPGMGTAFETTSFLEAILSLEKKKIIDADALNLCAMHPRLLKCLGSTCILTPHEGEITRLLSALDLNMPDSPQEKAMLLASNTNSVIVLKGPRSVIAVSSFSGSAKMNLSGCPAMATAGSGDVLTGIATALAGNGHTPEQAASSAVFLHGLAGECAMPCGSRGIIADDLISYISVALKIISEVS